MPRAHSRSTGRARGINRWKAQCRRKAHAEFGGRLPGKGLLIRTSLGSPPYPPSTSSTVTKMAARHQAKIEHQRRAAGPASRPGGTRRGKPDLVARFGGITLRQDRRAVITDPAPVPAPVPARSCSHGSASGSANSARPAPRWQSTRSPASESSGNRDQASPRGPPSWRKCGARHSSSARPAMTGSTRTRSRTRHKSLESPVPGKRARPVRREAARKRPGFIQHEHGTSPGGPPYQESRPAREGGNTACRAKGARRWIFR